ncbi:DinB family protein [Peribacillus sp. SCS-155]|uniref:DinB family protein n=1 Tax=Peribacillus sedimenti TaxID=3115297 RepID=UPI0039060289
MNRRPEQDEFHSYYSTYVAMVPEGDIITILEKQIEETIDLLEDLSDDQALFRYGEDKWSIKEVLGHVTDTERVFSYRLLSIARGETAALPGYDQNAYVEMASFDNQPLVLLVENFRAVRQSTLYLLKSLNEDTWLLRGNANGSDVTVRALAYMIAGHELHHRRILQERYLK